VCACVFVCVCMIHACTRTHCLLPSSHTDGSTQSRTRTAYFDVCLWDVQIHICALIRPHTYTYMPTPDLSHRRVNTRTNSNHELEHELELLTSTSASGIFSSAAMDGILMRVYLSRQSMCACVCAHVCVCVRESVCMCEYTCLDACVSVKTIHVCVCARAHVCVCVCERESVCMCEYTCLDACVSVKTRWNATRQRV
jgi:hypothetical protein